MQTSTNTSHRRTSASSTTSLPYAPASLPAALQDLVADPSLVVSTDQVSALVREYLTLREQYEQCRRDLELAAELGQTLLRKNQEMVRELRHKERKERNKEQHRIKQQNSMMVSSSLADKENHSTFPDDTDDFHAETENSASPSPSMTSHQTTPRRASHGTESYISHLEHTAASLSAQLATHQTQPSPSPASLHRRVAILESENGRLVEEVEERRVQVEELKERVARLARERVDELRDLRRVRRSGVKLVVCGQCEVGQLCASVVDSESRHDAYTHPDPDYETETDNQPTIIASEPIQVQNIKQLDRPFIESHTDLSNAETTPTSQEVFQTPPLSPTTPSIHYPLSECDTQNRSDGEMWGRDVPETLVELLANVLMAALVAPVILARRYIEERVR